MRARIVSRGEPKTILLVAVLFCCAVSMLTEKSAAQATSSLDVPQTRLAPIGPPAPIPGTSTGLPSPVGTFGGSPGVAPTSAPFDPYAGGPAGGYVSPIAPNPYGSPVLGAPTGAPTSTFGAPVYGTGQPPPLFGSFGTPAPIGATTIQQGGVGGPIYGAPGTFAAPMGYGVPDSAYPGSAPSTLFPGGLFGNTSSFVPTFDPYRIIQRGRFRHAYLFGGGDPEDLGINDTDVAFAFALPRFLWSEQPLFITPSFSVHLWDGPSGGTGADLPASAYSAFLDFAWRSDPNQIFGAELAVNVGSFSEFDVANSDSVRVRGQGLGSFRLTPASTFKLGVFYYDRVDVKILPAGGFLCRTKPGTKYDLIFPQPKISKFVSTVGIYDVWWYVEGDYGGGSWTIDRDDGRRDQVDINDIRVMSGFEWGLPERMRQGLRTAFFEFGYVFDRELVYRHNPQDNLKLDDTWMVRLGIGY